MHTNLKAFKLLGNSLLSTILKELEAYQSALRDITHAKRLACAR
jgi:hypothetical protein